MVEPFLSQGPISETKGKYTDKTTKVKIKAFLMDSEHGFTMTMPGCVQHYQGIQHAQQIKGTWNAYARVSKGGGSAAG